MNKRNSVLFREFLLNIDCHHQLRRHLEEDQRRWMRDEMELFFFRRMRFPMNESYESVLRRSRKYINPYYMNRQWALGGKANHFLANRLPRLALLEIESNDQLRCSRHDYLNRLTKSVALKYRDDILTEEWDIFTFRQEDEEMFFKRLQLLEKQADSRSIQRLDILVKDCECAEIAMGDINDASLIEFAFCA